MALILCVETATEVCSVCLTENGSILDIEETQAPRSHASQITLFIEKVLQRTNRSFNELDAIALSAGPGSYTGLRIGSSTAKGLCYALDIPLIAISTLKSMAWGMHEKTDRARILYCPMIDARRNEVYCAIYDHQLKIILKPMPMILECNSFSNYLEKHQIIFFGTGANKFKRQCISENALFGSNFFADSSFLAKLAMQSYKSRKFNDIAAFQPFYIKNFQTL